MATTTTAKLPLTRRPRRLRRTEAIRSLVRETRLTPDCFIYPLFVVEGEGIRHEVPSMPGVFQLSVDQAVQEAAAAKADGVPAVLLFGLPAEKDATGSGASDPDAPVQTAIRALKREVRDLIVITDVCLCEYTSHGHCGIVEGDDIVNDVTVMHLAQAALSHAVAGADIVAPSDMMDGRVAAIRRALDERGFDQTAIMSYAAKYCSGFYGPFREAVGSGSRLIGDKRTYQLDYANSDEAMREVAQDIAEGADMVMVKPGLPYLDIVQRCHDAFDVPLFAYQVSGEYAMIKLAGAAGAINGEGAMLESLVAFKRAGCDGVLTYFALEAARLLNA